MPSIFGSIRTTPMTSAFWEHSHHVSDCVEQLQDSGICAAGERAELPRLDRAGGDVERRGSVFPTAGWRPGSNGGAERVGVPHRPRREVQFDDALAVSAVEARAVGGI